MFPDKNNLKKEKPYVQGKIMRLARNVTIAQISDCIEVIAETDAKLKGMADAFNAMDTLECMVLSIARIVSPNPALR